MGSVTADLLLRAGHTVRVLDSLSHGGQALLGLYPQEGFEFINGDVRSLPTVERALEDVEAVVHLAAIVGDPACSRQQDLAREVNLEASVQLINSAEKAGVAAFVFASTCSNYGRVTDPTQYVSEDAPLAPVSLYAETKVAVEQSLLRGPGQDKQMAATVLRFATVFGVSPRMRFDLTVNEFTLEILTKKHLVVFGEQFWRPYLHVRDAARAIGMVIEADASSVGGQVFNVGDNAENFQKETLIAKILDVLQLEADIERVVRNEDPRDYRVAFDKIQDTLGFRISRTVDDGIAEVADLIGNGVITDFSDGRFKN